MSQSNLDTWKSDIWRWRFYGIAAYESILLSLVSFVVTTSSTFVWSLRIRDLFQSLINPWLWCLFMLEIALLTATLIAQAQLLRVSGLQQPRWLRSGFRLPKWFVEPVANILGQVQTVGGLIDLSLYYAASAITGAASMYYFTSLLGRKGADWTWWFGLVLGVLHATTVLARGKNVLSFPIIHQQRIFKLKKELPKGSCLLNIVMVEHLRFALPGDADPNGKLFAVLQNDKVEKVAKQVAAVLPQTGAKPGEARPESHSAPKWNVHPTSTKPLGAMGRAQEEAAGYLKSRCWQSVQCIRVLAALSVASQSEDRLGTAQLSEPTVGAVTAVLASTVSALQAYAKTCVAAAPRGSALAQQSMGPDASGAMRSGEVGAPVFALHDAAVAALYSILGAFGSELIDIVKSSKAQLPFGTSADVVALLNRCDKCQE
ncbi:hypothetical protein COCSUDRAFT_46908 [Coccomyxa subellipsoidea C-169]|uniref:Nucleoporin protein Ndc1-Nup n=1 Tax=Coccomyxa subellipsoidea (strain C-169) TaxID=574566 RepID=I0Z215_COCSC|nr:hypothetical protein COCSUDRAFT_46908 [Coccomyxa subellipsoidea C-169]EIE24684.1 hypothetical protein COCSUDRAFT_46908 [Coccomyxa subellipsoidea C-169]|eukprot:XP_005649228.1 hypothetical protein COCSUDRAFT_46908 [Coccomyxa subellipsoidea C-169]